MAEELDRTKAFPYEIVAKLGGLGLMGIPFPQEYGGGGADTLSYVLAVEELARIDSSVCITMAAHTSLGTMPIYLWGSDEQKDEWLPRLCSGERLASFGLTEPEAGSDAGNVRTTAKLDDGEWVVNGAKQFITNSGTEISGCVSITAVTGEANGRKEISNLIVPNRHPRLRGRRGLPQDGLERLRHPAALLRGLPGAGVQACSAAAATASRTSSTSSTAAGSASPRWASASPRGPSTRRSPTPRSARRSARRSPIPVDPGQDRRPLGPDRGGPPAHLAGGAGEGRRPVLHPHRRPGEADHRPPRGPSHRGGGADPRRLRLHRGVPGLPLLPRRQDPHDRRGDRRGAADGDRPPAAG